MREIKFRAWHKGEYNISAPQMIYECQRQILQNFLDDNIPLMQYTGLKDKNGKEIYEGDIIRGVYNRYPQNWRVNELSAYGLSFTRLTIKPLPASYSFRDMRHRDQWEVIGNIYDNPGLLEAK